MNKTVNQEAQKQRVVIRQVCSQSMKLEAGLRERLEGPLEMPTGFRLVKIVAQEQPCEMREASKRDVGGLDQQEDAGFLVADGHCFSLRALCVRENTRESNRAQIASLFQESEHRNHRYQLHNEQRDLQDAEEFPVDIEMLCCRESAKGVCSACRR